MKIRLKRKAFTLVELLVVMAIIGTLMSVSFVGIQAARERSKKSKAKTDVGRIGLAVSTLYSDTRKYPGGSSGLSTYYGALDSTGKPFVKNYECFLNDNGCAGLINQGTYGTIWKGPYYKGSILDPWGKTYVIDYDYYGPSHTSSAATDVVRQVVNSYGRDWNGNTNPDLAPGMYTCDDIYYELNSIPINTVSTSNSVPAGSDNKSSVTTHYTNYRGRCNDRFDGKVN